MSKKWQATLRTYLAACESRDVGRIVSCFANDARIKDPTGTQTGHEMIAAYFTGIYSDLAELSFATGLVSWCGPSCAVAWSGTARRHDGTPISYQGIDVFSFGDADLIGELWAFWSPESLIEI